MADNRKKKKKRRKKRKNPVPVIILIIVIAAAAFFGVRYVRKQVDTLQAETNKLIVLDIDNGAVDMRLYTSGNYAVVEETMKSYVAEYMEDLRQLRQFRNDDRLTSMLGETNLSTDGPEFKSSRVYIQEKRNALNLLVKDLKAMRTEERMMEAFEETGLKKFFRDLYREQMLEGLTTDYFYSDAAVDAAAAEISAYLDAKDAVLNFLKENSEGWTLKDGVLQFKTEELLAAYKELTAS